VGELLVGEGFVEAVTYSLTDDDAAQRFMPPNMSPLRLLEASARSERVLRPSILPSLLQVYARNRDRGSRDVKLFEHASTYAQLDDAHQGPGRPDHLETRNLAILYPAESDDSPLRPMRGILDRLVELLRGPGVHPSVEPMQVVPWYKPGAVVRLDDAVLGLYGMIAPDLLKRYDIQEPICAAEIGLPAWYGQYPPETEARELPHFPAIERDISAIVEEQRTWQAIEQLIDALHLDMLDGVEFVTTFRGKPIGRGRKSVTFRLRFRAEDRTLRHEEVDPQVRRVVDALKEDFNAEIRQ